VLHLLMRREVVQAMTWLKETHGRSSRWRWGNVHALIQGHPLQVT